METYAVIENEKVVNVCLATAEDSKPNNWILCEVGGIGWDYIDGVFVDNRLVAVEPVPVPVPTKEQLLAEMRVLMAKIEALA